jgi:hypothetical protein
VRTTDLLLWGIVIHLFCDWILQNDWQARNKSSLKHPAAYVHSGIHLAGLSLLVFFGVPWYFPVIVAITHILIDTRKPLAWWRSFFKQTTEGPVALDVALWSDQVAHITVLAIVALIIGGR